MLGVYLVLMTKYNSMQQPLNQEYLANDQPDRLRLVDYSIEDLITAVDGTREQERQANATAVNYDGTKYSQPNSGQTAEPDAHLSPLTDEAARIKAARERIAAEFAEAA